MKLIMETMTLIVLAMLIQYMEIGGWKYGANKPLNQFSINEKQFRIFLTTLLNFLFILMSRILKQLLKNTLSSYFCFEDLKSRE